MATFFGVFYFERLSGLLGLEAHAPHAPLTRTTEQTSRVYIYSDGMGHFETQAVLQGAVLDFVIDTGATSVALRYEDAQRAGLTDNLKFTGTTQTANGFTKVAPLTLPALRIGDIVITDVRAHVARPGSLGFNLLGMSFLRRLQKFEMRGEELVLVHSATKNRLAR